MSSSSRWQPRAAIAGAGLMGSWHARYAVRAGAAITGIIDRDAAAARLRSEFPTARRYSDLPTCFAQESVDVVHICTPPSTHAELARAAITARKHVLVEKPLAPTATEAEELVGLARHHDVILCPVHQFPFQRGCLSLRRRLPDLGQLIEASFVTCSPGGEGYDRAARRELLFEILPHPLSLFQALLGVDIAHADLSVTSATDDDLEVRGGARGIRLRAMISLRGRPTRNELTVIATRGTAHVDLFHGYLVIERGEPSRRTKLLQPFGYASKLFASAGGNAPFIRRPTPRVRHPIARPTSSRWRV